MSQESYDSLPALEEVSPSGAAASAISDKEAVSEVKKSNDKRAMADANAEEQQGAGAAAAAEAAETEGAGEAAAAPKKNQKPAEPPITFREFDVSVYNFAMQFYIEMNQLCHSMRPTSRSSSGRS